MAKYVKGTPKHPKSGRAKGTLNKSTQNVKDALIEAFEGIGGIPSLIEWGRKKENRAQFYQLWAKILPIQMQHTGNDGKPIQFLITPTYQATEVLDEKDIQDAEVIIEAEKEKNV